MLSETSVVYSSRQIVAPLVGKREVAPGHFRLTLLSTAIAKQAKAGHFVHILPRSRDCCDPLLRRAFSIVSCEKDTFDVLFRVTGRGTTAMSRWESGETVDLLGPLGQPFEPLREYSILVGGGVGVPPMAMLASEKKDGQRVSALIGAKTGSELLCEEDFARYDVPVQVATDDGSRGHHGFVTELLDDCLENASTVEKMPMVYACGPLPMLQIVAQLCVRHQAPCQVSLEENMPCGVGVCNGCVIPILGRGEDYDSYRRICVEGPVAWAHEICWDHWTQPI